MDSVLETTGGVARIATATSKPKEQQFGNFGAGIFKILQNRKQKGLTDLDIIDNHSARQVCATVGKKGKGRAYAAKLSSKTLGRVNASGHGHFTVRGQYSAATVRGTVWNVGNRCEGTLTHVTRGVVSVRDFSRRKTITLFTGQSYLAKAPASLGRLRCGPASVHAYVRTRVGRWPDLRCCVALAATVALAASAQAATYTVGTTEDTPRGEMCRPASGTCSLRQLIEYENEPRKPAEPTRRHRRPKRQIRTDYGTLEDRPVARDRGRGGAHHDRGHVLGQATEGRVFDVKVPGTSAELSSSGSRSRAGPPSRRSIRRIRRRHPQHDRVAAAQRRLDHEGTATDGGGISNDAGTLVVERSLVSGNHATHRRRGLGRNPELRLRQTRSGICSGQEGGPGRRGLDGRRQRRGRLGGGIFSWSEDGVNDENGVSIIDSTIAFNSTQAEPCGDACEPERRGARWPTDGDDRRRGLDRRLQQRDVAGEYSLTQLPRPSNPATIVSLGYNLENGTDCGFKSTGDLQNTSPEFSSGETLQNNGGNTDTLAPEPTSPAVDAIPAGTPFCNGTDQRGVARPQGAGCDIGAVELVPFTIEVTEGTQFSGPLTAGLTEPIYSTPAPTIEWGDGTASEGTGDEANSTASGTHTYARGGTYDGSVTYYNDDGPGTHKIAFQAKVAARATKAPHRKRLHLHLRLPPRRRRSSRPRRRPS